MIKTKYHLSLRIIHWLMAALIIFMLCLGIYMADFLDRESANRQAIYHLHKSLGVSVLLLTFIRVINRLCHRNPHLPNTIPLWQRIAAYTTYVALYTLMFMVPLSGYLMSNYYGYPVNLFNFEMMFLVGRNLEMAKIFSEIHEVTAYALLALVTLHFLAALKHRFFDKAENNVLKRII